MANDKSEPPARADWMKDSDTPTEDSFASTLRQAIRDEFAFLGAERIECVSKPIEGHSQWLDFLKAAPPILWLLLASFAFFEIGPDVWRFVKAGAVTKIGIGVVNLEIAQKRLNDVKGLDAAGIPPSVQAQLKRRFANVVDTANEVRLLWVDDAHPYKNLRERRVLRSLAMEVDLATNTLEAMDWLRAADYDIIITDLTREKDVSAPCNASPAAPARAGCDLINKVNLLGKEKPPTIIVYAGQTNGVISSNSNVHITNRPGDLFNAILDAIERLDHRL